VARTPPAALAVDVRAARRRFERAARGAFDDFLAREIAGRMVERLDLLRYVPERILDAGSGRGTSLPLLERRYPDAEIVAVDFVSAVLDGLRDASLRGRLRRLVGRERVRAVAADVSALPFAAGSFGCIWSNLALNWVHDLPATFGEWSRVLAPGGVVFFACFGPDTLRELRDALGRGGESLRAHEFVDMHDLGDMLVAAGFVEPVMDVERITLTYPGAEALLRELRASGQTATLAARPRGLWTQRRLARVLGAYPTDADGVVRATVEVVYGHAWKGVPRRTADGRAIVQFDRNAGRRENG
jgi:malonyl-CoA O-methyltransferase